MRPHIRSAIALGMALTLAGCADQGPPGAEVALRASTNKIVIPSGGYGPFFQIDLVNRSGAVVEVDYCDLGGSGLNPALVVERQNTDGWTFVMQWAQTPPCGSGFTPATYTMPADLGILPISTMSPPTLQGKYRYGLWVTTAEEGDHYIYSQTITVVQE
jgi:hypothetical protein